MKAQRYDASECRLCGASAIAIGKASLLKRHQVVLWECARCGFRQTDDPWWLEEAYRNPINRFDTGAFSRVLVSGAVVKSLVALAFDKSSQFLDFGGGYGLFVRHMRDLGLDFRWEDRFCSNLLVQGFEADQDSAGFALTTAFEVVEHAVDPGGLFRRLFERTDALLFSTALAPDSQEEFVEWDYIGREHGQHVAFYRMQTLEWLAKSMGLHLVSNGVGLHLLSRRPVPRWKFRISTNLRMASVVGWLFSWESLTLPDHIRLKVAYKDSSIPPED